MTTLRQAAEMALEALDTAYDNDLSYRKNEYYSPAMNALRQALAEPEQDIEKEIEAMKQDIEQFQMALREQVELNKNVERNLREFGVKVAEEVAKGVDYSWDERTPQLLKIVDEVMKSG